MTAAIAERSSEYVTFWNNVLEPKFTRFRHILMGGMSLHSDRVIPSLGVKNGDRILDVGCGFGDTAMKLAGYVGPSGSVLGVDCCEAFLNHGRRNAEEAGIANVSFLEADAQSHSFAPEFDYCFSRFGTQFFENPVAGLRNIRSAIKPGGMMTMIVWRALAENPCMNLSKQVILDYLPAPGDDGQSCGPGPFSMADEEMVSRQLESAGYCDIEFTPVDAPVMIGRTLEDAIAFQLAIGPAGEVFREAGKLAEERRAEITAALGRALAPYLTSEGVVMESGSWRIAARNPW